MSAGADRLAEVRRRVVQAARVAGRDPALVTLVAVSKTHGSDRVRELLVAGQRVFGENRVQEAEGKYPALKVEYPDLELHLIGPLQTNKARDAVALRRWDDEAKIPELTVPEIATYLPLLRSLWRQ